MDYNLSLQQQQTLSQSQIQSLNILSLDSIELDNFLQNEYLENPLLDYTEKFPNIVSHEPIKLYSDTPAPSNLPHSEDASIRQYILNQLDINRYNKSEWALIKYLTNCLDENGYFQFTPEEIALQTGLKPQTIEKCLTVLRGLEPTGIFSSGLTDCLIRQLDSSHQDYEIMKEMITNHMGNMASGKISSISRSLNISTVSVRKCMEHIRSLNPRPLSGFSLTQKDYIIPDIIYTYTDGKWLISLNDNWIENYHINDYYVQMLKTAKDPELVSYFKGKLAHVQFIFSCIEQRRKTLRSIAEEILLLQKDYFLSGGSPRPMLMNNLAAELNIHPSTFSRAIKGKYIQFPGGTVLCRSLFCASIISDAEGSSVSQNEIKLLIQKFIDSENKSKPHSDQTLVRLLQAENITVSRRAIAKYRQELGIGSSMDRKE